MIYRRKLRTILESTETTAKTDSIATNTLAFQLLTTQSFYLGFHERFASRYFVMGTVNTNPATLSVKYWDGDSWESVEDVVDQTNGLTASGWLSWKNVSNWKKSAQPPVSDEELYWVKVTTSANLSAGTTIQAVLNLFCDHVLLSEYYPELVSDTRYLPPGKSNFYEQYNAGKNMVIQELIKLDIIKEEAQVLNPEGVSLAAVHASAYCILNGIPNPDEATVDRKKAILGDMEFWVGRSRNSFDLNLSGEIEEPEKDIGTTFWARR